MAPRFLSTAWAPSTVASVGVAAMVGTATLVGVSLIGPAVARAAVMGAPKAPPHAEAVDRTQAAAKAVLAGAGAESCLRGKLTNALLGLSSSCEALGERSPLCRLADSAAVVTPMSLAFMRDTSTRLLELIATPGGSSASSGGVDSVQP